MLWACLLLPQLALDGVLRRRADNSPLVLVDGPVNARVVVAVNASAHAAGLRIGQRLTAAQALLAQFEAAPYDAADVARWQQFLASVAYRYSSQVALLPHAIVLEVSKSQSLFGSWLVMEQRLREDITALGFRYRIAAAPTPHGAYVMAGVSDGQTALSHESMRRLLDDVPLGKSRLPARAVDALPRMGVRRLGQLLRMPRDGLQRRFGAELLQAMDRLTGDLPAGLDLYVPPDAVDWIIELSHEVENLAALVFPLKRMTGDLAAYLSGRDGGVQRFVLKLVHRDLAATDVSVGMLSPERDADVLFDAARGRLEQVSLPAPVLALRLMADDLPTFAPTGRDLFDERPAHALPFEQLRERLRARLGDGAVYRWGATADPRPEHSQRVAVQDDVLLEPRPRPTWLLTRPMPLRGALRVISGPERLETGWWDGGDARRDYYVVETSMGQRAWAFCAPGERSGWMLHGWFA
ncbi:Y-family DNA polymerase [Dyella caseinilytica]|uniref:DNA polymerase Y family protein n=1 Tax=Dyella caseinilytica TaxID=1849581 RepID=A0ABX7GRW3_9GAMM|nr:DNA polymerase Y family protein [Dyella caseinilytica]QRN53132.1 DNA polymerase Y family protein [Dyella caseinilytica]GGA11746.1 DNA repair nucleotidyltransferase [Dyella caseinilytica]